MPAQLPTTFRHSMLMPLDARGRVAEVERRLVEAIELGAFRDGEQLPSEAALAAQLGVATVTLRDALAGLRDVGLLDTRRGRGGGSFVRQPETTRRQRLLTRLSAYGVSDLSDAGDLRAAVQGSVARLAAERATTFDHERLRLRLDAHDAATSDVQRHLADRRLHIELAALSRSLGLARAEAELQADARALLLQQLGGERIAASGAEHRAILDAVVARDGERAGAAAVEHVRRETQALIEQRIELRRRSARVRNGSRRTLRAVMDGVEAETASVFAALERARDAVQRDRRDALLAGVPLRAECLGGLERIVRSTLSGARPLLGMGVALAQHEAGDALFSWWGAGETLRKIEVNLERGHPEYCDFESAEWFAAPRAANAPWITGPFVEIVGSDAFLFTLTVPVPLALDDQEDAGDGVLGVVGADISVARLEQAVGPALATIEGPAAVLNQHDVVVVANTATWLPGTPWSAADADVERARSERLGWTVVASGAGSSRAARSVRTA